jgi:hypothetical protein
MTETNLPRMDADALAGEIVRRDRWRLRLLAVLTVALWIVAGLLIPAVYLPFAAKVVKTMEGLNRAIEGGGGEKPLTAADLVNAIGPLVGGSVKVSMVAFSFAILAAILASITTVALALTIRRATLRQVGAQLAVISEQLRQLQLSRDASGGGR